MMDPFKIAITIDVNVRFYPSETAALPALTATLTQGTRRLAEAVAANQIPTPETEKQEDVS